MKQLSLFVCIMLAIACSEDDDDNNVSPSTNNNSNTQESSYTLNFNGDTSYTLSGNVAMITTNPAIGGDTLVSVTLDDTLNQHSGNVTFRHSSNVYSPQTFVIGSDQNDNGVVFTYSLNSTLVYIGYDGTVEITDAKSQEYIHANFNIQAVSSNTVDTVNISGSMVANDLF